MEQKKLGVLGGMGPMATSLFFERIIENTLAKKDQDHLDMLILNHASAPDRTAAILNGNVEPFLKAVKSDFELFEKTDVANIAIPCNTSHYFYDTMQAMTSINIINMIDETSKYISESYGPNAKVGVLATNGTINTGIYQKGCQKFDMESFIPNQAIQAKVMQIIYQFKADEPVDPSELDRIINELVFKEGCTCVILGCTELSCIPVSDGASHYTVDAMQVLVEQSIIQSGKRVKKSTRVV
ncbi:aspartate/glutamate racemase family protein [Virgibacillus flavescens]|uniref:aspartate/glutamate racemase family protein n=1 Tax=Virgibacillus flavescens TaxID=1611422 RepID=UPI003D326706